MTAKIILILSGCTAVLTICLLHTIFKNRFSAARRRGGKHAGPEVPEMVPPEISGFAWNRRTKQTSGSFSFSVMKSPDTAQGAVLEGRWYDEITEKSRKIVGLAVSETDWDRLIRILGDAELQTASDNERFEEPDGTVSSFFVTTEYDGEWKCRLPRKETLDALFSLITEIGRKAKV